MVKALRSCLEAAKGKIKAGHLILRKSPQETGRDSTMMEFIGSLWGVHVYARDFGKNEVALARYLRGVGFKALQRTQKIL